MDDYYARMVLINEFLIFVVLLPLNVSSDIKII